MNWRHIVHAVTTNFYLSLRRATTSSVEDTHGIAGFARDGLWLVGNLAIRFSLMCFFLIGAILPNHSIASERMGATEMYLWEVIRLNRYDKLEEYIDEYPDVVYREFRGRTILSLAAWQGRDAMVNLLLQRGADPNQSARDRPLRLALDFPLLKSKGFLKSEAESTSEAEIENVRGYLRTIFILLEHGADYSENYTHVTDEGVAYEISLVEDIVSTICDELRFVSELHSEAKEISAKINENDLKKLKRSVLVVYGAITGLLSRECTSLFGIE